MNITDSPKLTEATTVYLLPMNVDEVDPNRRFNVDETIRLIKDLSNRHAEAPTRNVDTLVNTAAKNWKMSPNDPRFMHSSALCSQLIVARTCFFARPRRMQVSSTPVTRSRRILSKL
jgi:hypothetical protein